MSYLNDVAKSRPRQGNIVVEKEYLNEEHLEENVEDVSSTPTFLLQPVRCSPQPHVPRQPRRFPNGEERKIRW
ncbi:putative oxidoreductase protein [Anopheles sinensis]|uniref:Putative oxidoreductase protein n=1 Tax=Anopheles sinensis TaxID=74873 RepID=A0A084WAB9_ANOSI|nr:putative oxidoreductase protein [Anopheles sinensis]